MTEDDLFGNQSGVMEHGKMVKRCLLCGGLVAGPFTTHVNFHNSLTGK